MLLCGGRALRARRGGGQAEAEAAEAVAVLATDAEAVEAEAAEAEAVETEAEAVALLTRVATGISVVRDRRGVAGSDYTWQARTTYHRLLTLACALLAWLTDDSPLTLICSLLTTHHSAYYSLSTTHLLLYSMLTTQYSLH